MFNNIVILKSDWKKLCPTSGNLATPSEIRLSSGVFHLYYIKKLLRG